MSAIMPKPVTRLALVAAMIAAGAAFAAAQRGGGFGGPGFTQPGGDVQIDVNPTIPRTPPVLDPKLKVWDGIWEAEGQAPGGNGLDVPFTDAWKQKRAEFQAASAAGDKISNGARCIPNGPPMIMNGTFDMVVRPGAINIFSTDQGNLMRHIFVDGRDHTILEYLFDTFSGESIGTWEGDTLVIDTLAMDSHNEIIHGVSGTAMHVVERMRMTDEGKLEIEFTVEDAEALTKPWVYTRTYARSKLPAIPENYCVYAPRPEDPDALGALGLQ